MAAEEKNEELLNESWVDLSVQDPLHTQGSVQNAILAHGLDIERLLIDAQRESAQSSQRTSNKSSQKGSPKSPHSPYNEFAGMVNAGTASLHEKSVQDDWIWDWSSRPDIQPPSDLGHLMKHRGGRPRLSVRNTRVMKDGVFMWANLPALLVTHACSFVLGAAVMFLCMKKYWMRVATVE